MPLSPTPYLDVISGVMDEAADDWRDWSSVGAKDQALAALADDLAQRGVDSESALGGFLAGMDATIFVVMGEEGQLSCSQICRRLLRMSDLVKECLAQLPPKV